MTANPFAGAYAQTPYLANPDAKLHRKVCRSLEDAVERSGLKDGMTISFHHAFREGDKVVNLVVDTLARMGLKNLTLASSSLLNSGSECDIHQPCTWLVHAISVSPSQKPTVSPYHCEIWLTCFWPIRIWRRMFSAVPDRSCTW